MLASTKQRKRILVNAADDMTRIAIFENGILAELYIERDETERIVGNIYKGVVTNVFPGMQASFVDIGIEKDVFLYIGDIEGFGLEDMNENDEEQEPSIRDILEPGQEIVIQILKEPMGTKGARGTTCLTLPGRYAVLMPGIQHVGISKRIVDEAERERLRAFGEKLVPRGFGLIMRTVAEGMDESALANDVNFLLRLWEGIRRRLGSASPYSLIHRDLNPVLKLTRDLMDENTEAFIIDNKSHYESVVNFLNLFAPHLTRYVDYYDSRLPLFEKYGVEHEIEKALQRKVWLPCGGYFIVEKTEALTAIDVNTGKFVGKVNLEETVFETNMEAVEEIARQIRLRDIGGILVLDLIDMTDEDHKCRVFEKLMGVLNADRARVKVLPINEFGLVQLTRKRVRKGLQATLCQNCLYCNGEGRILSTEIVYAKTRRKIKKICETTKKDRITISAHPQVASLLIGDDEENLYRLEEETGKKILINANEAYHLEQFNIVGD